MYMYIYIYMYMCIHMYTYVSPAWRPRRPEGAGFVELAIATRNHIIIHNSYYTMYVCVYIYIYIYIYIYGSLSLSLYI